MKKQKRDENGEIIRDSESAAGCSHGMPPNDCEESVDGMREVETFEVYTTIGGSRGWWNVGKFLKMEDAEKVAAVLKTVEPFSGYVEVKIEESYEWVRVLKKKE